MISCINLVSQVTLRSSGADIVYGCHLLRCLYNIVRSSVILLLPLYTLFPVTVNNDFFIILSAFKIQRVWLHVIFKYMTQNEVHDFFRDDTEGVILFRVTERNETERSETKRNDFVSCFSNWKSAVCRTINNSSAERLNSATTPCTNVGRSCFGRNKVTKHSTPIGNY
jgi:hypothetical protein